jgi:4-amino-4-deoxy-L-arabinose transferase-like glycosyltransferase
MRTINNDMGKWILVGLITVVLLAGVGLRALFLTADPPTDITISGGIVGDAGQHSYGARNKILFERWSFDDWTPHVAAPVVNILINYPFYKLFGINLYSHRLIPVLFSSLALLFFAFMVYRLSGPLTCLLASTFVAFNYPIIIYSKAANRYFPMIFFFLIAVYFFTRGAGSRKTRFFIFSASCWLLAYLSQNHILYLLSLFLVLGIWWLIGKRIRLRHLAAFWVGVTASLTAWYLLLYLPHSHFFDFFVGHNKLVRRIGSPGQLFQNLLDNPFMNQMRSDPVVLLLAAVAVVLYVYFTLKREKDIPPLVELAAFWLMVGAAAHSIWGYRPTRFYLILIFPAAILAGWLLSHLVKNRYKIELNLAGILALISLPTALFFLGIIKYWRFLRFKIVNDYWWTASVPLFLLVLLLMLFRKRRGKLVYAGIAVTLTLSVALNLQFFLRWAAQREYGIVNTARVFGKVIPPSRVAGNWASLLSIGTPHQTHLLSGEMGVNWRRNFLKKHGIQYLLLTRGHFGNELREYRRFFKEEMSSAGLMALFRIYNTDVYLFSLFPGEESKNRLEWETFHRNRGTVVYDPAASQQMALELKQEEIKHPIRLAPSLFASWPEGAYRLTISAKGRFKGKIVFRQENEVIKQAFIKFNGSGYETIRIDPMPLGKEVFMTLHISRADTDISLDYLELESFTSARQTNFRNAGRGQ